MSIQFSPVMAAREQGKGGEFSTRSLDPEALGQWASPVVVLDDFRVSGRPFGPHPHAGFSAVTYVFEDSPGSLRSRDSLGNDIVMGPGGIVWTQAARGMMHEETPADSGRELHGLQIFVNLSSKNKLAAPRVLQLAPGDVPEWRNADAGRVRVVVGSFAGVSSPLGPAEPFDLLDVVLRREVSYDLRPNHNAIVYVTGGTISVRADGREQKLAPEHALALEGEGLVTFDAAHPAHFVVLSGAGIHEPIAAQGPFIMNDWMQLGAAVARFRAGGMGRLKPLESLERSDA